MKLVGRYDSPFVRRVGVSLHVLGIAFEHVALSPFSQATELRAVAPIGRMPALILDDGETLIDSTAILDALDDMVGPDRALLPPNGASRRRAQKIVAMSTAACDKAIAINYERRRPQDKVSPEWIERCRIQLNAALLEIEAERLALDDDRPLAQTEITTSCMYGYVMRVVPDALEGRHPALRRLSLACEARKEFVACPE